MASDDPSPLEVSYLNSCKMHNVLPNVSILSSIAEMKQEMEDHRVLKIFLDHLTSSDFPSLIDTLSPISLSEVDAVEVCQNALAITLNDDQVLSLLHAVNHKLHLLDIFDWSTLRNTLKNICHGGLKCQILNFGISAIRKLNIDAEYLQLRTLNLDFNIHLINFHVDCFSCMPNLVQLSVCATKINNLWTTCAALLKLPSLAELRFQKCLCCPGTGQCPKTLGETSTSMLRKIKSDSYGQPSSLKNENTHVGELRLPTNWQEFVADQLHLEMNSDGTIRPSDLSHLVDGAPTATSQLVEEFIHARRALRNGVSEMEMSEITSNLAGHESFDHSSSQSVSGNLFSDNFSTELEEQDNFSTELEEPGSTDVLKNKLGTQKFDLEDTIKHHPSHICFQKHYREFIISSLPQLKVLDNLPVLKEEREYAKELINKYYEHVPYDRQYRENVVGILKTRELGTSGKHQCSGETSQSITRSLSAAKVSSSPLPHWVEVSKIRGQSTEEIKAFRPRQFEYHPCDSRLMVFGTVDGELVVVNHESQKLIGYVPSFGVPNSILGLCWLKKYPSKLIAGSDNGSLKLYDVSQMPATVTDWYSTPNAAKQTFEEFDQLTSVHVNSTDDNFLVSGYSNHVALYDIGTGKRLQLLKDLHREHINVVKFSHHSPSLFATASFDKEIKLWDIRQAPGQPCYTASSSKGNVMVCFSPDDQYLLVSAIDNEVKQFLAVDGRLHMDFNIASLGSAQNYTRSYYMNGRDYVISGSCEEDAVRICCAKTGRRLRDISVEDKGSKDSMFVQSLRGDPYRPFHMSILAAYRHPCARSEIITVNLLTNETSPEEYDVEVLQSWYGMGG